VYDVVGYTRRFYFRHPNVDGACEVKKMHDNTTAGATFKENKQYHERKYNDGLPKLDKSLKPIKSKKKKNNNTNDSLPPETHEQQNNTNSHMRPPDDFSDSETENDSSHPPRQNEQVPTKKR
jgi:hypothetical protein